MTFAGLPATTEYAGTSFITTAPAPIIESCPIVISPMMQTFGPIVTLSSIHGHFSESRKPFAQIVVFYRTVKLLPITVSELTT